MIIAYTAPYIVIHCITLICVLVNTTLLVGHSPKGLVHVPYHILDKWWVSYWITIHILTLIIRAGLDTGPVVVGNEEPDLGYPYT